MHGQVFSGDQEMASTAASVVLLRGLCLKKTKGKRKGLSMAGNAQQARREARRVLKKTRIGSTQGMPPAD